MMRLILFFAAITGIGLGFFWWLSEPVVSVEDSDAALLAQNIDLAEGEKVFWASGCASCHAKENATGDEKLLLGGGHRLETPFGTFVTPNISPHGQTGIGSWTIAEFQNAMKDGVSPDGKHYYPSFPYTSYVLVSDAEIANLFAFMKTLPEVDRANEAHELGVLFSWRRPLGIWKRLFAQDHWTVAVDQQNRVLIRGQRLVEGLGHCGECHTPRNVLGGLDRSRWLAGGPAPEGEGMIPNITPGSKSIGNWSQGDIAYYLESGFTPDYDTVGGTMVSVQENMAKLPKEDLEAIAAYLKAIPAIE